MYFSKYCEEGKLIFVIWVDDIIIVSSSESVMKKGKKMLTDRFKMKDLGRISKFLGITFTCHEDGSVSMDQSHYLRNVLVRFGMDKCKPRATPCELKPSAYYDIEDSNEIFGENDYRAVVGSLVYAMTCTRPD